MRMYIGGEWRDADEKIHVVNPFDNSVVDTVPSADLRDVEIALASSVRGAAVMRRVSGYERFKILRKAADLMEERSDEFARVISMEEGKVIGEARTEVDRAIQTLVLSAEEAKRI